MNDADRHTAIKIYSGFAPRRYAEGGLVEAANSVADAGRMGDSMIVHINKREFDELRQNWGEPTINPETGMPEFFLGGLGKILKSIAGPAVGAITGALLPGIGEAVGGYFPGLAESLGPTGLQALLAGGLGAGAGYLTNGADGALLGGLGGAAGAFGADYLNGGGFNGADAAVDAAKYPAVAAELAFSPNKATGSKTGSIPLATLAGILNLAGSAFQNDKAAKAAKKNDKKAQAQFNKPLPEWNNTIQRTNNPLDYEHYGESNGENSFFSGNHLADGGLAHGRSDNIDAKLSEGEYVIDAETVALLGNGSTEAGADRLDQFRSNIRQHKGAALANGDISPDAAPVEQYLGSA